MKSSIQTVEHSAESTRSVSPKIVLVFGCFFFCQVWWFELKTPFYINTINETHHKETVCIYIFSASRCEVTCLYNVRNMNHSARSIGAAIRIWSLWLRTVKFVCHKVLNIICCDGNVWISEPTVNLLTFLTPFERSGGGALVILFWHTADTEAQSSAGTSNCITAI